jgi:hypothetical protein
MGRNPTVGITDTGHWGGDFPVPLKRPLLALLMAEEFKDSIFNGEKSITIREGWRDYKPSEKVILCCCNLENGWATTGKITKVTHCKLKEVYIEDLNADGMATLEDAVAALSQFYEGMNEESLVTVIRWELV